MASRIIRGHVVLVDESDAYLLDEPGWTVYRHDYGYVVRPVYEHGKRVRLLLLHRVILSAPPEMFVDHMDGNPLNNQRANIRLATHAENMRNCKKQTNNTSGYKGVTRERGKWKAQITCENKRYFKRGFLTPESAGAWYAEKAKELHGEFARLS